MISIKEHPSLHSIIKYIIVILMIVSTVLKTVSLNDKTNGTIETKEAVSSLIQQYLSSEHSTLHKALSDLSSRTDKLQTQQLELNSQIKNTS